MGQIRSGVRMTGKEQRHLTPSRQEGDDTARIEGLGLGGLPGGFALFTCVNH
jgi:hypothetical protein